MGKMTGGELLVETLCELGVRNVFSIIGGQMCSVYDALRLRPEMKLVTLRNEAAAAMMAAGSTAATGVPAVSMCTVGAGVVYEVAGLMAAWYGYLPVLSIAPQVQSWKMMPHQENLQGLNQDGIFAPITKWNAIVYHWERIPALTQRAVREAVANAPGPVHLDLPVDVLFQTKKIKAGTVPAAESTRYLGALPGPAETVRKAHNAIARAERPVALLGQGMGMPGRYPEVTEKLIGLGIPVLASDRGVGVVGHTQWLGLFTGSERGTELIRDADLVLIIGWDDEIGEAFKGWVNESSTVVQVETDPSALLAGRKNYIGVNADPISFLAAVERTGAWSGWSDQVREAGEELARELADRLPGLAKMFAAVSAGLGDEAVMVVDGTEAVEAARGWLRPAGRSQLYLMDTRDLAGVGLPFALGAKIGAPGKNVTLIADRDSLLRQIQELQTAAGLGLEFTIICVDPGDGDKLARLEAVLAGLGCGTARLAAGDPAVRPPSPALFAFLLL